jgi:hypothetical protein
VTEIDVSELIRDAEHGESVFIQSLGYDLRVDFPTVRVTNCQTGRLEAYSSSRADFRQSVVEFVSDYMTQEEI